MFAIMMKVSNEIMKSLFKWLDDLVFILTNILFSFIPVCMMLVGSFIPLFVLLLWFFNQEINLLDVKYVVVGLLMVWIGFKWDDAIIEAYPIAIARKQNAMKK